MNEKTIFKIIKYFGSQKAMAKALDVSQQAVNNWLNREQKIPHIQALKIVGCTEGCISLAELIPDQKDIKNLFKNSSLQKSTYLVELAIDDIDLYGKQCHVYKGIDDFSLHTVSDNFRRPILVDSYNRLITCECRIRFQRAVGRKRITVHRLNIPDLLNGYASIDSLLHEFPISERVDIGLAIERELGSDQGVRTDLTLPHRYAEVASMGGRRKAIAKLSGFKSHFSYGQVKDVLKNGIPAVVKAMDNEIVTITKARLLAKLPEDGQLLFISMIAKD